MSWFIEDLCFLSQPLPRPTATRSSHIDEIYPDDAAISVRRDIRVVEGTKWSSGACRPSERVVWV